MLGLLDRPTSGTYVLDGRETTSLSDDELAHTRARKIGFIFQSFHLVPRLTAFENVELPLVLAGVSRRASGVRACKQLLDSLSLGNRSSPPAERAVRRPASASRDRPGDGDAASRAAGGRADRQSRSHLGRGSAGGDRGLNARGITLLVVTHDAEVADRASRHIRMRDGSVVEDTRT